MIEVKITEEMRDKATELAFELGVLKNSIMGGARNFEGFLGELIAFSVIGGIHTHTYDYDIVDKSGRTIDVKTKLTSVKPKEYYDCSVANYNTNQRCDSYAFVRVHKDYNVGWYLGNIEKNAFYRNAIFHKKGEIDPANNFVFRADCYNLAIKNLTI